MNRQSDRSTRAGYSSSSAEHEGASSRYDDVSSPYQSRSARRNARSAEAASSRHGGADTSYESRSARRNARSAEATSSRSAADTSYESRSARRKAAEAHQSSAKSRSTTAHTKAGQHAQAARRTASRKKSANTRQPKLGIGWLDRYRKDEAGSIVVNFAIAGVVLIMLLGVFALMLPSLNLARARSLVNSGKAEKAKQLLNTLESDEYPAEDITEIRYALGDYYLSQGDYAGALSLQESLPEGERTKAQALQARYVQASQLYDAGDFKAAGEQFYQLGEYSDSMSRYLDCRAAIAISVYLEGQEIQARQLLLDIDAADVHIANAARAVAQDEAEAQRLLAMEVFSPESLAQQERDKDAARAALANAGSGRIAAGYLHTVGVRTNGTVLATGSNASGQCDVNAWTDITQVAAGAEHTVGLRRDGTVVATGSNDFGQCDVSGWTGITAIAANAYGTFGLKSDGTVVATERYVDAVSGWHGVTALSAGSYSAGCLYGQGSVMTTHKGARMDMVTSVSGLSVCGAVSAGILSDGTLVSSYDAAPDWHDLRTITVSQTGMIGVFSDGQVRYFEFRGGTDVALNVTAAIVEVASSGTHHVALTEDGRVFAFGNNDSGQCDVSLWQL